MLYSSVGQLWESYSSWCETILHNHERGGVEGCFDTESVALAVPNPSSDNTEQIVPPVVIELPSATRALREDTEAFCVASAEVDDDNKAVDRNVPDMADDAADVDGIFGDW